MKQMNITFEDKEYSELYEVKEDHGGNWHDFILDLIRGYKKEKQK